MLLHVVVATAEEAPVEERVIFMNIDGIKFKKLDCQLNGLPPYEVTEKYVNIYVRIADKCNANCPFCVYHDKDKAFEFDIYKFNEMMSGLDAAGVKIEKVSFTGGEPTTNYSTLRACIEDVRKLSPETFIVVNTNGHALERLMELSGLIDSVSLSRHHYSRIKNENVFRTSTVPAGWMIIKANNILKNIHLSCNLIKGYIDRRSEITKYLEHAKNLGIYDVGFVSLMDVNAYTKSNFIDFSDLNIDIEDNIVNNKEWSNNGICKCSNFLYLPQYGKKVVKFYTRHRCAQNEASESNLVYDGKFLRDNFGGKIIF